MKPHPEVFREILARLGRTAAECVFVGDNWLADIQGAKRAGMKAVYLRQYPSYEGFQPQPGDHDADAVIHHIADLRGLLHKKEGN